MFHFEQPAEPLTEPSTRRSWWRPAVAIPIWIVGLALVIGFFVYADGHHTRNPTWNTGTTPTFVAPNDPPGYSQPPPNNGGNPPSGYIGNGIGNGPGQTPLCVAANAC